MQRGEFNYLSSMHSFCFPEYIRFLDVFKFTLQTCHIWFDSHRASSLAHCVLSVMFSNSSQPVGNRDSISHPCVNTENESQIEAISGIHSSCGSHATNWLSPSERTDANDCQKIIAPNPSATYLGVFLSLSPLM